MKISPEKADQLEKVIERLYQELTEIQDRCDEFEESLSDMETTLMGADIDPDQPLLLEKRYGTQYPESILDYWQRSGKG